MQPKKCGNALPPSMGNQQPVLTFKASNLHPMSLNLIIMAAAAGGISVMLAVMRHNHNSQRAHLLLTDAEATEDA